MNSYLPKYERQNALINDILRAIEIELDVIINGTVQNYDELFIDTAVRALEIHERDLGISGANLSLRQRREQIMAKYRAAFSQTTEESLKAIVMAFTNGECEILETDVPGVYEIKFISIFGIPDNIDALTEALNIAIPAHLTFNYTFRFNLYSDIQRIPYRLLTDIDYETLLTKKLTFTGRTHAELRGSTHAELSAETNEQILGVLIVGDDVG